MGRNDEMGWSCPWLSPPSGAFGFAARASLTLKHNHRAAQLNKLQIEFFHPKTHPVGRQQPLVKGLAIGSTQLYRQKDNNRQKSMMSVPCYAVSLHSLRR